MKKILFCVAILACLASCKKEKTALSPGLFGKWELRSKSGGFSGTVGYYPPGNGDIYQFNSDSTYSKIDSNKVTSAGKFHIKITNIEQGYKQGNIEFVDIDYKDAFAMKKDTIYIGTSIADGIRSVYAKIK
ncbi:hypothetical protein [Mucilaginibacter sp. AK015]|uniref:hypothetical protein n=1 Tax=Mucilaginibacter sp. AK015 TaxID=2723072 RepID=UPI0016127F2D|nr:hypothetical protein [Mucilaginibacter sp. AK015]MBB5396215.1 hypothetical protein [Mucilaginibacter sp. AK015]